VQKQSSDPDPILGFYFALTRGDKHKYRRTFFYPLANEAYLRIVTIETSLGTLYMGFLSWSVIFSIIYGS